MIAGIEMTLLVPLVTAASVFVLVLAVTFGLSGRRELVGRIKAVSTPREQRAAPRSGGDSVQERGKGVAGVLHQLVGRVSVMRDRQTGAVMERLAKAGWRSKDAYGIYTTAKMGLPVLFGGIGGAVVFLAADSDLTVALKAAVVLGAALAGSYLPDIIVRNAAGRRQHSIRKALPDALDLMVICAEAGLSLDAALTRVAREIAPASKELADELGLTVLELRFLPERRKPLENLARRVDLAAMQALINTLLQTEKFGTPLAQALRVLAQELRTERMLRAEEKAARLPAIMTVPLIIFILPALFVVLLGSAILDIADVMSQF